MRIALAALLLAAAPAVAEDETVLFTSGAWDVVHVAYDDGTAACRMGSMYSDGRAIGSIVQIATVGDSLSMIVFSADWNAAERDVPVRVVVDRESFDATARVAGRVLVIPGLTVEFIAALASGHTMSLVASSGAELLRYSLSGTAAATAALLDCWTKLPSSPTDPFGAASAPADPF